jgi:hypothetical protein
MSDGTYPHNDPRIYYGWFASAQVHMGLARTNAFRKPQGWPVLRAKATRDYVWLARCFSYPRRRVIQQHFVGGAY